MEISNTISTQAHDTHFSIDLLTFQVQSQAYHFLLHHYQAGPKSLSTLNNLPPVVAKDKAFAYPQPSDLFDRGCRERFWLYQYQEEDEREKKMVILSIG